MEWIAGVAEQYGLFAALVVYTLYDNKQRELRYRKDAKEREERYINTIDGLSINLNIVGKIQEDVDEIKDEIKNIARR